MSNVKVTIDQIKALRNITGAGILDCKSALEASDSDIEKAAEYIKEKGLLKLSVMKNRICKNGYIGFHESDIQISYIEVLSETDFVSKNDKFRSICNDMARFILENPECFSKDSLSMSDFDKDPMICNTMLSMRENISIGRIKVFDKSKGTIYHYIHNNPYSPDNIYFAVIQLSHIHNNGPSIASHFAFETDINDLSQIDMNAKFGDSSRTIKDELGDCKIIDFFRGKVGQ